MKLQETIIHMNSNEYKERFKAEYWQLLIRIDELTTMLDKYLSGTLSFIPACGIEMLKEQLDSMINYSLILECRAKIEGIGIHQKINIS